MKNIDYRFKFLYVIGIVAVVAGHLGIGGIGLLDAWFPYYAYHLPLFTFCSGYFYSSKSEDNVGNYIIHKVKTLLIPLYLWHICYGLLVLFSRNFGFTIGENMSLYHTFVTPLYDGHSYAYNLGSWYIVPLFMIQVFNVLIRKVLRCVKIHVNEYIMSGLYLLAGMGGVVLSIKGYNVEWWLMLTRFLLILPFYGFGILYKNKLEKIDRLNNIAYFGVIFMIQLIVITMYGYTPAYSISQCLYFDNIVIMPFLVGILGIAFWLRVSKILEPILSNSKTVLLIADNTFSIMVNHFLGFMAVKMLFGVISKCTHFCSDFNMLEYKTNMSYFYFPRGNDHWKIVYLVAGIVLPILIQLAINKVKQKYSATKAKR